MKKIFAMFMTVIMVCSFVGCASITADNKVTEPEEMLEASVSEPEKESEPEKTEVETTTKREKETEPSTAPTEKEAEPSTSVSGTSNPPKDEEKETQKNETPKPTEPPHVHSYTASVVAPTCEYQGYTLYTCSCGASYKDNWTSALGHAYVDTVVPATTEAGGYTEHTCSRCGASYRDNETERIRWDTEEAVAAVCAEMNAYMETIGVKCDPVRAMCWAGGTGTAAYYSADELRADIKQGIDDFHRVFHYPAMYVHYEPQGSGFVIQLRYMLGDTTKDPVNP